MSRTNDIMYIDETQLSDLTGIAVKTLQGMRCKGGGFPYIKIGRLVRYDIEKVKDFMNKNTRQSTWEKHDN